MAHPLGQVLSAPITNGSPIAQFGTHIDYLGMGGYRSVATIADRDAIPTKSALEYDGLGSGMRRHLMLVGVQETGLMYILYKPDFKLIGADAAKLAALKDNANWVLFTDFLNVQSNGGSGTTPNELSADQLSAVQAANSPSNTNHFLTAIDLNSVAFPKSTKSPRTLFVQGFGQTTLGVPGNPLRPYTTVAAAVAEAKDYDTIVILPGGDSTDYLGRPCYSEAVGIGKSLQFVFQGGIISGYWVFGTYPGIKTTIRCTIKGGIFTKGLGIVSSNGQQCRYAFSNCNFEDASTIFELVPSGFEQANLAPGLDIQTYENCNFANANPTNGDGVFKFQGRDDASPTQHLNINLQNCRVSSLNTPIATGYASVYHLIYLRGTTELILEKNQPKHTVVRVDSTTIINDSGLFVDERVKDGNSSTGGNSNLNIYNFDEYVVNFSGVQTITLPNSAIFAFDISIYEVSNAVRTLYKKDYSFANSVLTISAEANLIVGDKICGSYFSSSEVSSPSNPTIPTNPTQPSTQEKVTIIDATAN